MQAIMSLASAHLSTVRGFDFSKSQCRNKRKAINIHEPNGELGINAADCDMNMKSDVGLCDDSEKVRQEQKQN